MISKRIVITGMGVVSPVGIGVPKFWANVSKGVSGTSRVEAFDPEGYLSQIGAEVKDFDPTAYIEKKEVRKMDRFIQFAIAAAHEAITSAGLSATDLDPATIGVSVGSGVGGLWAIEEQHEVLRQKGNRRIDPFLVPKLIINLASGQIAMNYRFQGPNLAYATACATGLHSIGEASWIIRRGDADIMIAGGTEACITPLGLAAFGNMRAISTRNDDPARASRPFEASRDGFVIGEGAGVVVLESLESAARRGVPIIAEIVGYGLNGDAHHITAPVEDGSIIAACMRRALASAGLTPDAIDYINAHGTATPLNDLVETRAIKAVFGARAYQIPVNSTKSMIGHLLGAAGGVELITTCLSIVNGLVHPTINYEAPDPQCDLDYVPNQARRWSINHAMCNSFGFGGTNAVLIVKRWE